MTKSSLLPIYDPINILKYTSTKVGGVKWSHKYLQMKTKFRFRFSGDKATLYFPNKKIQRENKGKEWNWRDSQKKNDKKFSIAESLYKKKLNKRSVLKCDIKNWLNLNWNTQNYENPSP